MNDSGRMDAIIGTAKHMESLAKGQIAAAENRVVPLAQQVAALEAENAALKAPVSVKRKSKRYKKIPQCRSIGYCSCATR